jgi:hypothetical protein
MDYFLNKFDYNYYLSCNIDLSIYEPNIQLKAINHAFLFGLKENRKIFADDAIQEAYKSFKNCKANNNIINILIRCTYCPTSFKKCIDSILIQSYDKEFIKIYICYDDIRCLEYLNNYKQYNNIGFFQIGNDINKNIPQFYNLYSNELLKKVEKGWIIFLDEDDMFSNKNALELINIYIKNNNSILFWKFKCGENIIYPNINNIKVNTVASCGYCFNSIYKDFGQWETGQQGDYNFLKGLLSNVNFEKIFINNILTKTSDSTITNGNYGKKEVNQNQLKIEDYSTLSTTTNSIFNKQTKISIIMPYYNRKEQLQLTLNQFEKLYSDYNIEVIIIDDQSDQSEKSNEIINNYSFGIKYIELTNKTWINPVVAFNVGIRNISSDTKIIMFQSPEIFHCDNIIEHTINNLTNTNYLTYPVFASPSFTHNNIIRNLVNSNCINYYNDFITNINVDNKRNYWYNHILYNNRQLHFLSSMSIEVLNKIGGFNNDMKDGLWYDDDDFLNRIKKVANVSTVNSEKYFGIHLYHKGGSSENRHYPNFFELSNKNKKIMNENTNIYQNTDYDENIIKINITNSAYIISSTYIINEILNKDNNNVIIYYSKTNYRLLFQRPHQIMRFFDSSYLKIFIGLINEPIYEKEYNLYVIPYNLKSKLLNSKLISESTIIYYTDTRLYGEIAELKGKKLFDLIDAPIDEFAIWKPNLELAVKNSDIVIYSHPDLIDFLNPIDSNKSYNYISNACDYEYFSKAKEKIGDRPKDFPSTDKPILGYYGAFSKWLDYDVIQQYADEGNYHLVMIGGVPSMSLYNIKLEHPNITWLNHKPYDELAYYLSWFDACFLPIKDCELTKYVNPCKLWEYMTAGKPIIKTNVNIECEQIVKYTDVCNKLLNIIKNTNGTNLLIVLDKYRKGGTEKHTEILKEEFNCDIMVFNSSVKNHIVINSQNYIKYKNIIWQNTFNKLPPKQNGQIYIYVVHSQCDWWSNNAKRQIISNNDLINIYIFVSQSVRDKFESQLFKVENGYVIENQVKPIINDKKEIPGLFVSSGLYNPSKNHLELIKEFSKLDTNNILEIYGDIHDKSYYNHLQTYIETNNINNIKLFEYTDNYIERLKEAEYFCLFSKSEGCSYSILEAIALNKKIICSEECLTTNNMREYKKISYVVKNYSCELDNKYNRDEYKYFIYKIKDVCEIIHEYDNKICYVSSITGNYDEINTINTNKLDYYLYTDSVSEKKITNMHHINIKKVPIEKYLNGLYKNDKLFIKKTYNMMCAKYIKINHHKLAELEKYKYTIWIDGRTVIKNSILLKWLIYDLDKNNISLAVHNHSRWTSIFEDALYCKNLNNDYGYLKLRYDDQDLIHQAIHYCNNNFIDNNTYVECGFIIRNKNEQNVIDFFNNWWTNNMKYTYQDQISFKYLLFNSNIKYKYIGNNVYNNEYTQITHHKITPIDNYPPFKTYNGNLANSWDFWDTLGGRICYKNTDLFKIIEKRLKIFDFANKRIDAERQICDETNNNFTIRDIYKRLYQMITTNISLNQLIIYEYLLEIDLLFLIPENTNQLDEKSIIVSDFFYEKDMFCNMLYIKKIWVTIDKIFVSNAGKLNGNIWDYLVNLKKITCHTGDNKWSDCEHPKLSELNIKTNHYTNQSLNSYENYMIMNNYPYLGYIMRSVRLSNPYVKNSTEWELWNIYSDRYLPIMFLKIFALKKLFDLKNTKMVFMSRDGYFLLHLYRSIFPDYDYDYLYVSRIAMKNADSEYVDYVKNKVKNAVVIDLLGTGKSFFNFCKKFNIEYNNYIIYFMGRSDDYIIEYFPEMKMYAVFNYFNRYIERLNYATHGSFIGFNKNNNVITSEFEYDTKYYEPIYKIINKSCEHVLKVHDIISEYNFEQDTLYKFLFYYLGTPDKLWEGKCKSFNEYELSLLDNIGHTDAHTDNNYINTNIERNYFYDLDEYFNTNKN